MLAGGLLDSPGTGCFALTFRPGRWRRCRPRSGQQRLGVLVLAGQHLGDVGDLLAQRLRVDARARCCRRPASRGAGWSRRWPPPSTAVILSAYMCTWPDTLRAARPIVWISDLSERRKPSLSASRIDTSDTSGRSRPSRSRLMPTRTSYSPSRRSRSSSIRLQRVDLGVEVAGADAGVEEVVGEVLRHLLGQRGDQDPLVALGAGVDLVDQVVDLALGRLDHDLGVDQPGRPDDLLDGVAADLVELVVARASPRGRSSGRSGRGTPPTAAAGCPSRWAAGSRGRPGCACGTCRPRTCRRSAAPRRGTRR